MDVIIMSHNPKTREVRQIRLTDGALEIQDGSGKALAAVYLDDVIRERIVTHLEPVKES